MSEYNDLVVDEIDKQSSKSQSKMTKVASKVNTILEKF